MTQASKRNYKKEYSSYHSKPSARKARSKRVMARRVMTKAGRVKKGDGKDVGHKRSLGSGGSNSKSNLRVQSQKSNRAHGGRIGNKAAKRRGGARGGRKSR